MQILLNRHPILQTLHHAWPFSQVRQVRILKLDFTLSSSPTGPYSQFWFGPYSQVIWNKWNAQFLTWPHSQVRLDPILQSDWTLFSSPTLPFESNLIYSQVRLDLILNSDSDPKSYETSEMLNFRLDPILKSDWTLFSSNAKLVKCSILYPPAN